MRPLKWKKVREATAVASAPALLRSGNDGDEDDVAEDSVLGQPCPTCKGTGIDKVDLCSECNGAGYLGMKESTSGPYWVYSDSSEWEQLREASRTFSSDVRKKYASSGIALPDGSYPIPDQDALKRAVSSFGHNPTAAVKAHIKKRAAALGASGSLPEDWQGSKEAGLDNLGDKKSDAFGKDAKSKESEPSVLARLGELEGQIGVFRRLAEARPGTMTPAFSTPTRVKTADGEEGYQVDLIREGKGNSEDDQWYTADAIKEMCESGFCEGMQAYGNHPDLEEEELRPERDVKQLVGHYRDVKYVKEGDRARAEAIFVPLTLDERNPNFGWVVTLAEAAAKSKAPQPICGISLYGLSAGDDENRPDGSFGRMVSMIRPQSGDIVTSAGAGGGFIRQVMESARKALRNNQPKELSPMRSVEYQTKVRETAKRLREASTDEDREAALQELATLEEEAIDQTADLTIDSLREAAPSLVKDIEDAATATETETTEQLRERNTQLEKALGNFTDAISVTDALREAGVTDPVELRHYAKEVRTLGLREASEIKDHIDSERAFEEQKLAQMREALGSDYEDSDVEGAGGRVPVTALPSDGGVDLMRESGLPLVPTNAE